MKIKNTVCIILCITMLFSIAACKKNTGDTAESSTVSPSDVQSVTSDNVSDTSSESNTSSEDNPSSTTSSDNANSSQNNVSSNTSSENNTSSGPGVLEMLYGFKSIKSVDYCCIKNISDSDAMYVISEILTDNGTNICDGSTEITCDDSRIKINSKIITIPRDFANKNKSVKLTACHTATGLTYDFNLNFEKEWDLIFEDEFEGTKLDTTKWNHSPEWLRDKGYVNYWDHDLTFVDGKGHLVSRAAPGKKTVKGEEIDAYLSGAITGKGLFESSYGYYEISAKLHHQTGMWGAFWLVCGDMSDPNPPADKTALNGCEIDVFESLYNYGGVCNNLHWDGFTGNTCSAPSNGYVTYIDTYDNDFHTFAVSWTPYGYVFLIDGIITRRIDNVDACNQPGYMLITTECGTWGGEWVLEEGEYSDMLVDYVRVYSFPNNTN